MQVAQPKSGGECYLFAIEAGRRQYPSCRAGCSDHMLKTSAIKRPQSRCRSESSDAAWPGFVVSSNDSDPDRFQVFINNGFVRLLAYLEKAMADLNEATMRALEDDIQSDAPRLASFLNGPNTERAVAWMGKTLLGKCHGHCGRCGAGRTELRQNEDCSCRKRLAAGPESRRRSTAGRCRGLFTELERGTKTDGEGHRKWPP